MMGETLVKDNKLVTVFCFRVYNNIYINVCNIKCFYWFKKKRFTFFQLGSVVTLGSIFIGPITGSSMNPRSIGGLFLEILLFCGYI